MICRIFYTDNYSAKRHSLPKVGTKYEINTFEDLQKLNTVLENELIVNNKNLPRWLDHLHYVWQENWLSHIIDDYDDIVEVEYLTEYPDNTWLTDCWIEVYNGRRE